MDTVFNKINIDNLSVQKVHIAGMHTVLRMDRSSSTCYLQFITPGTCTWFRGLTFLASKDPRLDLSC
jgi:hypothetical protein